MGVATAGAGLAHHARPPLRTLAERIRAGGAGIGAFYTPTGYGTLLAEEKETRVIDGRGHVLEYPIRADLALIKAHIADGHGNLVYRKTGRNFGPLMATAATRTVAQVENLVPAGGLDPERIVTPSIHVDVVAHLPGTGVPAGEPGAAPSSPSSSGSARVRPVPPPGASYFHHADTFAMMRGAHPDLCVMGAYQVSQEGDLANWHPGTPDAIPSVGGAMDLGIGAKEVWVVMALFTQRGEPKLVPRLTYPVTAAACVSRVFTDHGVFALTGRGVVVEGLFGLDESELRERIPKVTFQ